jgi:flavin reductase (DIM6/NTAB) family NADH-FMN oxidoreductase RutF
MGKIKIDNNAAFIFPMSMVLVGAIVNGKANFMPVGLVSKVNMRPSLIAVGVGTHYTNNGIEKNKQFSINIPDVSLIEKTDYCGLVSGDKTDKSNIFGVFYGELEHAPLITECPICISCKLFDKVKLPSNTLYIGEPNEVFTEEKYLTDHKPDLKKINPFVLTMPDNKYWSIGELLGQAWNIGKKIK